MELSREHIIYTLGIPVPLNESIQLSGPMELKILHEQMLYETFLDTVKNYAQDKLDKVVSKINDWKDFAAHIGQVLSNPEWLKDLLTPLYGRVLRLLKPLNDFLKKLQLDSFIPKIKDFLEKIKSQGGWKAFMGFVALGSIITYITDKLKNLAPDAIKKFLADQFSGDFVNTIFSKLTDWKSYLGYLQPVVKGVEIIFNFLQPFLQAAVQSKKEGGYLNLMKENKMKKSDLKKLIREQILKEAEAAPTIQGQIKNELFKKLGVAGFDPAKFSQTINLVKQNQSLNTAANKVLADVMIAMIKTSDDTLLTSIFQNLKSVEAK